MDLRSLKNRKWNYLPLCFAFPLVGMLALLLVAGCLPFFDTRSMLYSDMWHQYYPFFHNFREALLSGESLLYNWDIGMGIDYIGLIAYYLASPLNLLSVLVPEKLLLHYFSMLVPLKLSFAGLFFGIFLKKIFGKNDIFLPLFSTFYAMCAWALGYQWNVMWLDAFALLPLVALGTVLLLKERKFLLYTITLFLAVASNYYIGFFVCIFVFLIFVCYQICRCKSVSRFFTDLGCIALFSVLALGMTAILFIPGLAALKSTQSSVNAFPKGFALNMVDAQLTQGAKEAWQALKLAMEADEATIGHWLTAFKESIVPLLDGMRQVAGNMGGGIPQSLKEGLPNLYCGVGTIIFAFLFLTAKKVKLRDKICCVCLLLFFMVSFIFRALDYMWHGFHFPNMIPYRFSFLFSFVMVYMAYRAFLLRRRFQLWQLIAAGILTMGILACSSQVTKPVYLAYNCVFLLLYLGLMIWSKMDGRLPEKEDKDGRQLYFEERKQRKRYATLGMAAVLGLELVLNVVNFGVNYVFTDIPDYPRGGEYLASMIRYMEEDDSDFYRAELTHSQTLNDGALNGYSGISTFTSSANVGVTEFMQKLGYAAKNNYNRYTFEESSPVANLFLNLKYMIDREGELEENPYFEQKHIYGGVALLENNAYLPLGFLTDSGLGTLKFGLFANNFLLQNLLFKRATGLSENVWKVLNAKQLTIEEGTTGVIASSPAGKTTYKNENASSTLSYVYTIEESGFLCLDLSMSAENNFVIYKNGEYLFAERMALAQTMSVCQVEPGDEIKVLIYCRANESGTINILTGLLDEEVFWEGYEILAASTLDITHFSNTKVEGTIDCDRDGLLYTSIPQDGNWSATVDGEPAEITLVGGVMASIYLTEGSHTVCFTYENKAFALGWKISLACLVVFGTITVLAYRRKIFSRLGKKQ